MTVYIAFFMSPEDNIQSFGWSTSEALAKMFLDCITDRINTDIYEPTLIRLDCQSILECDNYLRELKNPPYPFICCDELNKIRIIRSRDKLRQIAITAAVMDDLRYEMNEDPSGWIYYSSMEDERTMYNSMYMIFDSPIIKNDKMKEIMKKFIIKLYENYTTIDLIRNDKMDIVRYVTDVIRFLKSI